MRLTGQTPPTAHDFPTVSTEELRTGSSMDNYRVALGVEMGKYVPLGYDEAAKFIIDGRGTYLRPANYVWLRAEATIAGRLDDAEQEFPNMHRMADRMIELDGDHFPKIREKLRQLPDYVKPPKSFMRSIVGKAAVHMAKWAEA